MATSLGANHTPASKALSAYIAKNLSQHWQVLGACV